MIFVTYLFAILYIAVVSQHLRIWSKNLFVMCFLISGESYEWLFMHQCSICFDIRLREVNGNKKFSLIFKYKLREILIWYFLRHAGARDRFPNLLSIVTSQRVFEFIKLSCKNLILSIVKIDSICVFRRVFCSHAFTSVNLSTYYLL